MSTSVLIVDDEETVHDILDLRLQSCELHHAYSGDEALTFLEQNPVDVVILDLNLPGINGFELLDRIRERAHPAAILVLTGHFDSRVAFEAGRRGADDFLDKSFSTYERIVEYVHRARDAVFPSTPVLFDHDPDWMPRALRIIESTTNRRVRELVEIVRSSPSRGLALLAGEPGVDRLCWAHYLHSVSERSSARCVSFDARRIPPALIEGRLFGPGGICTQLEREGGGTLFVDHAHHLPRPAQIELIRIATEPPEGSMSVVFGADEESDGDQFQGPLDAIVRSGTLLLHLRLPPLRERREEVPERVKLCADIHAAAARRPPPTFTDEVLAVFSAYDWPGNDDELDQIVGRLVVRHGGSEISADQIPPECFVAALEEQEDEEPLYRRARRVFERHLVRTMLARHRGDRKAAAAALGVSHSTIKGKLRGSSS